MTSTKDMELCSLSVSSNDLFSADDLPKVLRSSIYVVVSPVEVTEKLFFAIFGEKGAEDFMTALKKRLQPHWTVNVFKVSFSVYMLVSVIVLINLLIAMMSDTYQRIVAQSDLEWKYGLSKLVRSAQRARSAPVPLNLFTTWIGWLRNVYKERKEKRSKKVGSSQKLLGRGRSQAQGVNLENGKRVSIISSEKPTSAGSAFTFAIVPGINTIVDWKVVSRKYRSRFGGEPEKPGD